MLTTGRPTWGSIAISTMQVCKRGLNSQQPNLSLISKALFNKEPYMFSKLAIYPFFSNGVEHIIVVFSL